MTSEPSEPEYFIDPHACVWTQSNTVGGSMHRIGLQSAKTETEESCHGPCLLIAAVWSVSALV